MDVYDTVTSDEHIPVGVGQGLRVQQRKWHKRANSTLVLIYLGCSDDILPHIKKFDDPNETWEILRGLNR
jgi:hypothetical protein